MEAQSFWIRKALNATGGIPCGKGYGESLNRSESDPRPNPSILRSFRFALCGSLICLFLSLLVAATLIVVLSPGCDPTGEGHNGTEVGALKTTETNREGKLMREAKQIGEGLAHHPCWWF